MIVNSQNQRYCQKRRKKKTSEIALLNRHKGALTRRVP